MQVSDNKNIKYDLEALKDFELYLSEGDFSKVFFLVDENTHENCLIPLLREIESLGAHEILEVEAGEQSKSPEVIFQLWMAMSDLQADRKALLVNVGGGVICDLGGFLASTYMRGIPFVNFPSSLLAQVDASVGGKTGINLDHKKNQVGVFAEAQRVYIIHQFLETLPLNEHISGFAEMLKHSMLHSDAFWESILDFDIYKEIPSLEMIQASIAVKKSVVEKDLYEQNLRKKLNLGHTLGHAIESASFETDKPLLHGEAIAFGLMGMLHLSTIYTAFPHKKAAQMIEVLKNIYDMTKLPSNVDAVLEYVYFDKKNNASNIQFVLLKDVGDAVIDVPVPIEKIRETLMYLKQL